RLGLEMVIETGEILPAGIAAQLDHARPENDPEQHPSEQPDRHGTRFDMRRTQEYGQETALQEEGFPAEGVEGLADIDKGEVEHPEERPDRHGEPCTVAFGQAGRGKNRKQHPAPAEEGESTILRKEEKDAGRFPEGGHLYEAGYGQKSLFSAERSELVHHDEKGNKIDEADAPLQQQPCQPVSAS